MTTFKKKFTIKANGSWIDPPARERCGTAVKALAALVVSMENRSDKSFRLRILKSGLRTTKCELECPDKDGYDTLKLLFLCDQGAYFDWRG